MFFDTHAHYDDARFDADRGELLASMPSRGVSLIVNPGCDMESSNAAIALAEAYSFVYAAVGWHPEEAELWTEESEPYLRRVCLHPKVKAIGEIGLDYYYEDCAPRELQCAVFERQLALAAELNLPVIVHDREAHADSLALVRLFPAVKGVFHCFSGSAEMAKELLKLGWYLSFTGSVTFKNARKAPEVITCCPMERIMLETDSPYLAPVPFRGQRNDSTMLPQIARRIAEIKGISEEECAQITMENGKKFFGIE